MSYRRECASSDPLADPLPKPGPGVVTLTVYRGAWSPDGRYLVLPFGFATRLAGVPTLAPAQTERPEFCTDRSQSFSTMRALPAAPASPGLVNAAKLLPEKGGDQLLFSWSPDGAWLLAWNTASTLSEPAFALIENTSGKTLWRMPPGFLTLRTGRVPAGSQATPAPTSSVHA